jgi:hypothetical protein
MSGSGMTGLVVFLSAKNKQAYASGLFFGVAVFPLGMGLLAGRGIWLGFVAALDDRVNHTGNSADCFRLGFPV